MTDSLQALETAIAALQAQRALLGDGVVDAALAPLLAQRSALAGGHPGEAPQQLRQVSVLFADVVGSTALSRQLDPEDVHATMDGALAAFSALVRARGGRVLQYAGDSLLAAFGADQAAEDDAEQAVHAGLAIVAEAAHQAEQVRQRHGHDGFGVRVGIHTGPVLLGGGVDGEGSIRGITVNIAARMEQTAPAGGLRISHDTLRLVRGLFDVQAQPPLQVKGVDAAVDSCLVLAAKARALRNLRRGVDGLPTPLVGRQAELDALGEAFDTALRGPRAVCCTVLAEAGLGKSRLVEEFERCVELRPEAVMLFRGRGHPQGLHQPYGVLRDLLFWRFQVHDSDSLTQAQAKLAAGVHPAFGPRTAEQAALLGHLLGLDFGASPHIAGIAQDARQLRERAVLAGNAYFRHLAQQGPLLLVLEDLHWADAGSLDFFEQLQRTAAEVPLLILGTARPALLERRPDFGAAGPRITLHALAEADRQTLTDAMLRHVEAAPPLLRDMLVGGADGNPFYMEELLQMLLDSGVVVRGGERWQVHADRLHGLQVPPTLVGVLQARLDSLPADERSALQQASVVGHRFWDEALAELQPDAPTALPALGRRELTLAHDVSAFEGAREFTFKHHVLHQVTYESVLRRQRQAQHRLVALWLEQRSAGRSGETLGLVAQHFERAGMAGRAATTWTLAAEQAVARHADEAALAHAGRALALTGEDDLRGRHALARVREMAHAHRSALDDQQIEVLELQRLSALIGTPALRSHASQRQAFVHQQRGDWPQAEAAAKEALALAGPAEPGTAARAHNMLFAALLRQGRHEEARRHGEAGLPLARAGGDGLTEAHLLSNLALLALDTGRLDDALARCVQAEQAYTACGSRWGAAFAQSNHGLACFELGLFDEACQRLQDALALCQATGNRAPEVSAHNNLANALLELGQADAALEVAEAGLARARALGDRFLQVLAHDIAGNSALALDRLGLAGQHFDAGTALCAALGSPRYTWALQAGAARLALARGDCASALACVTESADAFLAGEPPEGNLSTLADVQEALHAVGDPRHAGVLALAHAELQRMAQAVADPALRGVFLGTSRVRLGVQRAWQQRRDGTARSVDSADA